MSYKSRVSVTPSRPKTDFPFTLLASVMSKKPGHRAAVGVWAIL